MNTEELNELSNRIDTIVYYYNNYSSHSEEYNNLIDEVTQLSLEEKDYLLLNCYFSWSKNFMIENGASL